MHYTGCTLKRWVGFTLRHYKISKLCRVVNKNKRIIFNELHAYFPSVIRVGVEPTTHNLEDRGLSPTLKGRGYL